MLAYRLAGASLGWFAVLGQYWLSVLQPPGFLQSNITFFSFFTILSNVAVAAAFTAPLLPQTPPAAFLSRPGVRTAIAVYIFITGVIFFLLLRQVYRPTGFAALVNDLLHYVMPTLYIVDWAVFVPTRALRYAQLPFWLIFPLLFCAWTLIHGAASGFYPYPFLNVEDFGYHQIVLNILGLTILFILVCAAFIAIGRRLP